MSNPAQLTHGVRAALHAPVAAHRSRLRRASRLTARMAGRRVWQAGLAILVLTAVATGAVLWSASGGRAERPHSPAPASSTQPLVSTEALAADVLHRLDQLREQAFARRQAALLTHVYLPGPLLQQDTALLERVVPRGCGLVGVRTTYTDLDVRQAAGHLVLATTATLAASTLTCNATQSGGASGEAPTRLRIELVRQPDGYRIAGQQKLG